MTDRTAENTPTLVTGRLLLRRACPADAPAFLKLLGDVTTNTFLPWYPVQTLQQTLQHLEEQFFSFYQKPSAYRYAVCLKTQGVPIGYVNVGEGDSRDLGYALRREYWGQGLVTEAARAVVERLRASGAARLTATHDVNNPASGRVMRKLGFTYRYSYIEQWQPKDIPVTFRMYQLDFVPGTGTYMGYWQRYPTHFIEKSNEW